MVMLVEEVDADARGLAVVARTLGGSAEYWSPEFTV
jgi:hypothetical protein